MSETIADLVEADLRARAEELTQPGPDECLTCYVYRMLVDHGCDNTLRFARRFRDLRSPTATGSTDLVARLLGCGRPIAGGCARVAVLRALRHAAAQRVESGRFAWSCPAGTHSSDSSAGRKAGCTPPDETSAGG